MKHASNRRMNALAYATAVLILVASAASAQSPSFDCSKVDKGSIEAMACGDASRSAQDGKLAEVYAQAVKKAANEHPPTLKAMQLGWIKRRDDCWKNQEKKQCVTLSYTQRIAELQATYRLVPGKGPVFYFCDGERANDMVATFFEPDPPSLIAERGDRSSLMYLQQGGGGSKYQGPNETFREHQGEAMVTWGYDAKPMNCKKDPQP